MAIGEWTAADEIWWSAAKVRRDRVLAERFQDLVDALDAEYFEGNAKELAEHVIRHAKAIRAALLPYELEQDAINMPSVQE